MLLLLDYNSQPLKIIMEFILLLQIQIIQM
nr:MAG TPA: hypothetical protein [Caudoviricetes sp.]